VRLPDFVIIGAMKCGTSTLHEQLAARSRIFMSEPKEPNFFSDDPIFERGLGCYASLFAPAEAGSICGESSTHYTKRPDHPHTVERLGAALPAARFVYVTRDPLERIVSQFIHEWTQNEVRGPIDRMVREVPRFVAYSSYALQIEPYLRAFGPRRILLVVMEQLLARPDAEFARILRFLGDPSLEPVVWRQDLRPRNVSQERVRKAGLYLRLRAWTGALGLRDRLPESLKARARTLWQMRERPTLSEGTRSWARERLDTDLARLGDWMGRELRCDLWPTLATQEPLDWRPGFSGLAGSRPFEHTQEARTPHAR